MMSQSFGRSSMVALLTWPGIEPLAAGLDAPTAEPGQTSRQRAAVLNGFSRQDRLLRQGSALRGASFLPSDPPSTISTPRLRGARDGQGTGEGGEEPRCRADRCALAD